MTQAPECSNLCAYLAPSTSPFPCACNKTRNNEKLWKRKITWSCSPDSVWPDLAIFLKLLVTIFLSKEAKIFVDFLSYFGNLTFWIKNVCCVVLGKFWIIFGLLYISTSGHTGQTPSEMITRMTTRGCKTN